MPEVPISFNLLPITLHFCLFVCLIIAIIVNMKWYLFVVWVVFIVPTFYVSELKLYNYVVFLSYFAKLYEKPPTQNFQSKDGGCKASFPS